MSTRPARPGTPTPTRWTPDMDATLMEAVAEGQTLTAAGALLGMSRGAAIGRFDRLRKAMGWQAQ